MRLRAPSTHAGVRGAQLHQHTHTAAAATNAVANAVAVAVTAAAAAIVGVCWGRYCRYCCRPQQPRRPLQLLQRGAHCVRQLVCDALLDL